MSQDRAEVVRRRFAAYVTKDRGLSRNTALFRFEGDKVREVQLFFVASYRDSGFVRKAWERGRADPRFLALVLASDVSKASFAVAVRIS